MDTGRPSLLVVDDEPLIREFLAELAVDEGYSVKVAAHAREAVELVERDPDISVVITDVRMPGKMSGIDLVVELRRRAPAMQLILASGHLITDDSELPEDIVFLLKPFSVAQVIEALRKAALRS